MVVSELVDSQQTEGPEHKPLPEVNETVAHYDQVAVRFAAHWGELRLERALKAFARRVTGGRRVLDLGCGPGRDVAFLAELGCQPVGLDLSLGMLAEARHRLPTAPWIRSDLRRLPFAPNQFDGVWACASLLHLPRAELPPALSEILRMLRQPGGVLFLALKGGQGEEWLTDGDGQRYFFAFYNPAEIRTMLRQAGFQVFESWVAADQAGRNRPWINFIAGA